MGDTTIGVLGATGFTGRLVCQALERRGIRWIGGARNPARPILSSEVADSRQEGMRSPHALCNSRSEILAADVHDSASIFRLLRRSDLLINCVGPYAELGLPVVKAALEARVPVFDLSGEQEYVRRCAAFDAQARRAGIVIGNSMGVEVALSDCAAALAASGLCQVDEVHVAGAAKDFRTSPATRSSALGAIWGEGFTREGGCYRPAAVAHRIRQFALGTPFGTSLCAWYPGVECYTIPRHLSVPTVATYIRVPDWSPAMLKLAGRLAAVPHRLGVSPHSVGLLAAPLRLARNAAGLLGGAPGPSRPARFEIRVDVLGRTEVQLPTAGRRGDQTSQPCSSSAQRSVSVTGLDPYGLSAEILVLTAMRLLSSGPAVGRGGILSPSQVVPAEWLFSQLELLDDYDFGWRLTAPWSQESSPPPSPASSAR